MLAERVGFASRLFIMVTGAAADARRAHAMPFIAEDATWVPDLFFSGPDIPIDENSRQRFFGEDHAASSATA
jgi:hypothetical protein